MVDKATDGDNSVVTLHPDTMEHLQLLRNAQILSSSKEAQTPRDENGREWSGKHPHHSCSCFFFCRERERDRRTGKRKRYYGISGMEHIGRERVDYDRELVNKMGNTDTCNQSKHLARHINN